MFVVDFCVSFLRVLCCRGCCEREIEVLNVKKFGGELRWSGCVFIFFFVLCMDDVMDSYGCYCVI